MKIPGDIKVLIGCELSGRVRRAFDDLGFDVWSCDLLPSEDNSNRHIVGDIREVLQDDWDLLAVFHPPCTRLCNSGVRWLHTPPPGRTKNEMWAELDEGASLFSACWNSNIACKAVENPIMHKYAKERIANFRPPAQTIQPWQFGDQAFKGTSLWLDGLPKLQRTSELVPPKPGTDEHKKWSAIHRAPPGPDRAKIRSRTFQGIANAVAAQWGDHVLKQANQAIAA